MLVRLQLCIHHTNNHVDMLARVQLCIHHTNNHLDMLARAHLITLPNCHEKECVYILLV